MPTAEQDAIASRILAELADEHEWERASAQLPINNGTICLNLRGKRSMRWI